MATNETDKKTIHEKKTLNNSRVFNFVAQIACLVAAIGLWFYVQDYNSPSYEKKFTNIPITIQGSSNGFTVLSGYDSDVDVTVRGRKSDINRLSANDITAYIDISDINEAGNISCPVGIILPSGLEVKALSSTNFWLYIDKTATASVPVYPSYTGYTESGLTVGHIMASPSSITVTGPEAVLKQISGAYCSIELDKIVGSISARQAVTLLDKNGETIDNPYVKLATKEVLLTLPVYREITVPIKAQFIGGVHSINNATVVVSPSTIRLRGRVEDVDKITEIVVDVDESKIEGSGSVWATYSLPKNVENLSGDSLVKLDITLHNNVMKTIAFTSIKYENAPSNVKYVINTAGVTLTVRGPLGALSVFDSSAINGVVDLSVLEGKESGSYQLPIKLDTNFANTGVYAFGEYNVSVTIVE